MGNIINIYCDESCHLENDGQKVMVLGGITCPKKDVRKIADEIRGLKEKFGLSRYFEIKWTKVSPAKLDFYLELINYFYSNSCLTFRALVIPDKSCLRHGIYKQNHDDWYYKMYFLMLKTIINPQVKYNIYIDIKDTHGGQKVEKLHDVLCNNMYDFSRNIIKNIQQVHSHEVQQLQLADLFIGALKTVHLGECKSSAKIKVIETMKVKSECNLIQSTLPLARKTNIFVWTGGKQGECND